jgi:hypothetical protein
MSQLNVNKITGTTGTTSGAPITLSGDTVTLGTGTTIASGVTNNAGVASGTIASGVTGTLGSGIVYPTGHVIQTIGISTSTQRTTTSNSWTSSVDLVLEIENIAADSKVLIMMTCPFQSYKSGAIGYSTRTGGAWGLMRGTTHLVEQDICRLTQPDGGALLPVGPTVNESCGIVYLDETPPTGASTYTMIYRSIYSPNWTLTQCGRAFASASYTQATMVLQEIQA